MSSERFKRIQAREMQERRDRAWAAAAAAEGPAPKGYSAHLDWELRVTARMLGMPPEPESPKRRRLWGLAMSTTANQAHKKLTQLAAIHAALGNEQLTRQRVEMLEDIIRSNLPAILERHDKRLDQYGDLLRPLSRGFLGRLWWLVNGK